MEFIPCCCRLGDQCVVKMSHFSAGTLSQLLWAFASAGHRHTKLMTVAQSRALQLEAAFSEKQLQAVLYAYRRLGFDAPLLQTEIIDRLAELRGESIDQPLKTNAHVSGKPRSGAAVAAAGLTKSTSETECRSADTLPGIEAVPSLIRKQQQQQQNIWQKRALTRPQHLPR